LIWFRGSSEDSQGKAQLLRIVLNASNKLLLDGIQTRTYNRAKMTSEEMERAIEFLLDHHAKVSTDIERHSEQIGRLTLDVSTLNDTVKVMQQEMEANRVEIRGAIDSLIVANEVTRKLAEDVARLTTQNSQRITRLEEKAS
jgi:outer membrane murein-binding lipoprotein Lpp